MTRSLAQAMWRGFRLRCPCCGKGHLMARYTRVAAACGHCGQDLSQQRVDDAPAYFTIILVGHIAIPLLLLAEIKWSPPVWVLLAVWPPAVVLLAFWLLPRVKGATVGLQWANRMHGFGGPTDWPANP